MGCEAYKRRLAYTQVKPSCTFLQDTCKTNKKYARPVQDQCNLAKMYFCKICIKNSCKKVQCFLHGILLSCKITILPSFLARLQFFLQDTSYVCFVCLLLYIKNYTIIHIMVVLNAKQKHPGCKKSARPIRSSIANRYVRPKTLISVEAKKLLIKNLLE